MAEEKKQLEKTRKRSAARSRAAEKPKKRPVARTKRATAGDSPVTDAGEQFSVTVDRKVDGEESLRDSVNQLVATKANKIAERLIDGASKGNAACAKLLLELMSDKKQVGKPQLNGLSKLIGILEREPEWVKPETNDTKQT